VLVAYEGIVYDVTDSPMWKKGVHVHRHNAGSDLTDQLAGAPHWAEVFNSPRVKRAGILVSRTGGRLPGWLQRLFEVFPSLRRHPHPVSVHFPTAYILAGVLFSIIHLGRPGLLGLDFLAMARVMAVLALLATIGAVFTGLGTLWINYKFKTPKLVRKKLAYSAALVGVQAALAGFMISGPEWAFHAGMFLAALLVIRLGYLGGQMVFPTGV
jgi:predicted heme/steroid binding protein/uncharacterized membrane protein